jgi:hypothetical protein
MSKFEDLSESIVAINSAIAVAKKHKVDWEDDEKMYEIFVLCHKTYWSQIHEYYTGLNNDRGEKGIRKCVKEIMVNVLPLVLERIKKINETELLGKYLELYDDLYALVACRSLKHFAQYMEFDKKPEQKLWEPTMHLFGGYWYYANSMVLNGDVKFISKQCFTGLGKTYSNAITLSFIFGNDINSDALYVFGASANVGTFTLGLIDLMIMPRYAKVFPYFRQFQCGDADQTANAMFSVKQAKDTGSNLRISGSSKPVNVRVVSKDKNTNGVRAKFLFLDDIAQLADANNPKAHEKDIFRLTNEWFKRNYDLRHFFIIVGGTTYSVDDILTHLLNVNNGDIAEMSKINKFTKIAKSNYIIRDGLSVFVCVPKLDYETDESTYPLKYPTEEARLQRDNALDNGRMFEAMEQQRPLSSIENPFDWGNIHIYEELPKADKDGGTRNSRCRFVLDPSRKGNDKTCCLFYSQDGDRHYLVDAFVDNQPLDYKYASGKTVLETICEKIKAHRCFEGIAEENTESTIESQIKNTLSKLGYNSCKVKAYYSYKVKKDKIYSAQTAIQSYIWFPSRRVFTANSEVGRAMFDITYWKYKENIADDAPECCANYCEEFIKDETRAFATVRTFKR